MTIADRIFEARKEKLSLTQAELADALDVESVTVSRWERGIVEPRPSIIRELARLTGMPISWFFSGNGDEESARQTQSPPRTDQEVARGTGFDETGG